MRLLTIFILFTTIAFSQNSNVSLTETESLIQAIIESDESLKTGDYVVFNELIDIDTVYSGYAIKKFDLKKKSPASELILNHINMQLITKNKLDCFKILADSLNRSITNAFEKINVYRLIGEQFHKKYCEFSKPLYSNDSRYALVKFQVQSGFGLFSLTYLMKKKKGKWIEDSVLQGTDG